MNIQKIIKDLAIKYFSFNKRIPRKQYIFVTIIMSISLILIDSLRDFYKESSQFAITVVIYTVYLFIALVGISNHIRRLHDINFSGWWLLFSILIAIFIPLGQVLQLIFVIIIALLPGTKGPNKYGPDPLERDKVSELMMQSKP